MKLKNVKMALMVCLFGGVAFAGTSDTVVVTSGAHALDAMMTFNSATCSWTVNGHADPKFKGFGGNVSLVCMPYDCAGTGQCATITAGSTIRNCNLDTDGNFLCPGIDACTGSFSFTVNGSFDDNNNCVPQAPPGQICFFVAHVNTSNRQACNGNQSNDVPDPTGSAPCVSGYCRP